MGCNRAWDLMMKSLDNKTTQKEEHDFINHLSGCGPCKTRYNVLTDAFDELQKFDDRAPEDLEARIMVNIKGLKHKEISLLPFIIPPAVMFFLLAVIPLIRLLEQSDVAFVNQIFHFLNIVYNAVKTILMILERLFKILYIKQAFIVLLVAGAAFGSYCFVRSFLKSNNRLIWRI